ncbi:MAG: PHP domain-containing protein [Spirochaetaceae bacterium]|jgi:predicted metal-dependent phosphoesterase TrpH|nr:PHP domain-containing protein [Spirochaetaceae bacterium]
MIDLHTHSTASDGDLTPAELMRAASKHGLTAIALTDHDTTDGLPEARDEANKLGIRLIQGVEVGIDLRCIGKGLCPQPENSCREFHVLGLGLTAASNSLIEIMAESRQERTRRNLLIIGKMREAGIDADYEEVCGMASGCVGRPHLAQYLVKLGRARNFQGAFDNFLAEGKPFYIQKSGVDFTRAVAAIHESGGIVILAHPMTLRMSLNRLPQAAVELKESGLDGIEAWHPAPQLRVCRRLEAIGRELGLRITAGSDFHGKKRPDRRLGYTGGGRMIDDGFLEKSGL